MWYTGNSARHNRQRAAANLSSIFYSSFCTKIKNAHRLGDEQVNECYLIDAELPAQTRQSGGYIAKFGLGSRTIFELYLGDDGDCVEVVAVVVEVKAYGISLGFDEFEQFVDGVEVHGVFSFEWYFY
jgi:hypothetical protein